MFKGIVTLLTVKHVKNIGLFTLCFISALWLSRYGMPLYSITNKFIEFSHQVFGKYQSDIYEAGTDPLTFTTLLVAITLYALIIFWCTKIIIKKLREKRRT
ncbi:MAG TPA: hypothetical protein DCX28_13720 [Enterobacteriaceae bacterium]|nr:hypothetical protein [Enterobacteriaceae bacterium]